jgi:anti-anti-sigma factor
MNPYIQLIPSSEYDRIPIKAIETWLTIHGEKVLPDREQDDLPRVASQQQTCYGLLQDRQYDKEIEAIIPGYYQQYYWKPHILNSSNCAYSELDEVIGSRQATIITNLDPFRLAEYLNIAKIHKLPAKLWQILPPDREGCDRAIENLRCLQNLGIQVYFLVPQFQPLVVDWQKIFLGIRAENMQLMKNLGGRVEVFPLIDIQKIRYTHKDLKVYSIASAFCRTSPEMQTDIRRILGIFKDIQPIYTKSYGQVSTATDRSNGSSKKNPERLIFTETLSGNVEFKGNYQLFRLIGILDAFSEPSFRKMMDRRIEAEPGNLIIDLSNIDFVDSSGLGALVQVVNKSRSVGGTIQFIANQRVRRTIELVRLENFLSLQPSIDAAIAKVTS